MEGLSQRAAAKAAGLSRHAVRVALLEPVERKYTLKEPKKRPKASVVEGLIESILKQDLTAPPKQRHTARRIVAAHKQRAREVFVPLEYEPGAEAQVDFGEAEILLNGVPTKVHLFCMKLAFSRMPFVMAFPSQKQEAFFEGHVEAFAFFGGVPRRLSCTDGTLTTAKALPYLVWTGGGQPPERVSVSFQVQGMICVHGSVGMGSSNVVRIVDCKLVASGQGLLVPQPTVELVRAITTNGRFEVAWDRNTEQIS